MLFYFILNRQKNLLIILTAFVIALMHYVVSPYHFTTIQSNINLGSIAEKDIIAPFEFYIYKSDERVKSEQDAAAAKILPVYQVSENLRFNAQKNLDFIFEHFFDQPEDLEAMRSTLRRKGYDLSPEVVQMLADPETGQAIYSYLAEKISDILSIGIYPATYTSRKIKVNKNNRIIEYSLSRLYSIAEAKQKLRNETPNPEIQQAVNELANIILIENIIVDNEITQLEKQKAREEIPLTLGKVLKNEKIISKNQKVTTGELLKLNSLIKSQNELNASQTKNELLTSAFGVFILSLFLLLFFVYIIIEFFDIRYVAMPNLILILISTITAVALTVIIHSVFNLPALLIPFGLSVFVITQVMRTGIGIIYNFFLVILVAVFLNWNFLTPMILAFSTMGGIFAIRRLSKQQYYPVALYSFGAFLVVNLGVTLSFLDSLSTLGTRTIYFLVSLTVSITGLMLLLPIAERKLNLPTKQILLELLNFDSPLLKQMSQSTPGTYHHSLIVGNLAESAAEAIGADHLLARVGSYYHDIGKITNPQFFIENNPDSSEIHDRMLPHESAAVIRKHINEGLHLAEKHNLPSSVIDIIRQHHGTSFIRYFYNKAIINKLQFDDVDFQYQGPKPQTREAVIVMIADIVESTTKSLDAITENTVRSILDVSVERLISEGQLDEAPITLSELAKVKHAMLPIIMGIYRKRLEYPEQDPSDQQNR